MKLLVTGAWNCTGEQLAELEKLGYSVVYHKNENEPLKCSYDEIDGVICNGLFLYHDIEEFKKLKFIQLTSAGFDRVPVEYIKSNGIKLYNAAGVYSVPMAEFAISGILYLYKGMSYFAENQKKHIWSKKRDIIELNEKKALIFGCGSVGIECAKRLSAFGCEVYGADIVCDDRPYFLKVFSVSEIEKTLHNYDIVISALPLTKKTQHFFNSERLRALKESSVFVNVSRGGVVDTKAIIKALADKKIYGAVLDVFEEEPLPEDSDLWDLNNVVLTPHNSFVGDGNLERLFLLIQKNLKEVSNL